MTTPPSISSNSFSLDGFEEISSQVKGIRVFAPVAATPDHTAAPVEFKCPNCGASTRFDVNAGGVACEHCGYTAVVTAQKVGLNAELNEFTLDTLSQAETGWGLERKALHCESCGAELSLAEGSLTSICPFCGSNKVNIRKAPSDHLRPKFIIPFKVTPESTRSRAREWLGKGWFHPAQLASSAILDRFNGVYLAFWTFGAQIQSHWNAEVGYEREERYYDDSSKEWRTRTVIDWRWEDGDVSIQVDDLLLPGNSKVSKIILEKLKPFNLEELQSYSPDFLAGWQAQVYDIPLTAAWDEGKARMRESAKDACYHDIPTSNVRNFSMTADFSDEVWRFILLPVYITAYQFENKIFQIMVNGQTGAVAGQKPVEWWKIWAAMAAMFSPGLFLCLVGLPLLAAGGIGVVPLLIGIGLSILAIILSISLYKQAVDSEAA